MIGNLKLGWINKTNRSRFVEFGKFAGITFVSQLFVQAVALVSGFIIIRKVSTQEYALYTIANTMLGTMTLLADGGIVSGVTSQAGRVWNDRAKLGQVMVTGFALRQKFAFVSLIIAVPALIYLLISNGATWLSTILIVVCLIPAFLAALSDSILEIPLKLSQKVVPLQKNQIQVNLFRIVFLVSTIYFFPLAFIAILTAGIPRIWGNFRLRKIIANFADRKQPTDVEIKKKILGVVRRVMPGTIYYCLSGQITIWLMSLLGNTRSIAEVGALGRLAMAVSLITVLYQMLVIPRFVRLPEKRGLLLKRFFQINLTIAAIISLILLLVWLFPHTILLLLGKNYYGLEYELFLNILATCLSLVGTISFFLSTNRGWTINPILSIGISVISLIIGILIFDVSTLKGVLYLSIFTAVAQAVMHFSYCLTKILKTS